MKFEINDEVWVAMGVEKDADKIDMPFVSIDTIKEIDNEFPLDHLGSDLGYFSESEILGYA